MLTSAASGSLLVLPFFFADVTLKGCVVLALTGLTLALWRRSSAAARHLAWVTALCSLIFLPLSFLVLPRTGVPVPVAGHPFPVSALSAPTGPVGENLAQLPVNNSDRPPLTWPPAKSSPISPVVLPVPVALPLPGLEGNVGKTPVSEVPPVANDGPDFTLDGPWLVWLGRALLAVWCGGTLVLACRLVLGIYSLNRLRKNSEAVADGPLYLLLRELATMVGVRQRVNLLLSDDRAMPMTWGLGQAVILLPRSATAWSEKRLRMVLLHELGHICRRDALSQLLTYLVSAAYWFNPLVWWAAARMRLEQERACDDLVLAAGCKPSDYAENLLALSTTLRPNFLAAPLALAISRAARLRRRLVALLDDRVNRRPLHTRTIFSAVLGLLCICLALAPFGIHPTRVEAVPTQEPVQKIDEQPPGFDKKLGEAYETLKQKYIKKLDDKKLLTDAVKGMLSGLDDPYADYYDPEMFERLQKEFQGQMAGIGVQIKKDKEQLKVVTPLEDSPAFKAGIKAGDIIVAINGKNTLDLSLQECVKMVLGPVGTPVKLTIQQGEMKKEISVIRGLITLASVHGFQRDAAGKWNFMLDPANKIGYVQISQFNSQTTAEVSAAIKGLQKQGLKGLILDLRFCPGGLLKEAIHTANLFLAEGTILSVKDKDQKEDVIKAKKGNDLGDFPLVILMNQNTASSAEIVSGALQDNKRAVLLGTRTFGKGTVQSILTLKDGSALKFTTATYYLPKGRNIQKKPGSKTWGVDPDEGFYLSLTKDQTAALEGSIQERFLLGAKGPKAGEKITPEILEKDFADPQLAAGLKTMSAKIATGKFTPVGSTQDALQKQLQQLEQLQKQQKLMQQQLQLIQDQLIELENILGKEKK